MKVALPTLGDRGLDEQVSEHFGRAPTFTIVDSETGEVRVMPNRSEHMGGSGKPPEHLAREGVRVMLASGMGPRAIAMFEGYGIEVFMGAHGTVRESLEMWRSGALEPASDETACREHRH
ncbi:MAG: NifB/NifX family molybdenum-iron cluster-binding protein [Thermoplasmatota archaeon]